MPFRVIIAGGREYNDYPTLKKYCDHVLQNKSGIIIVSGKAKGADSLGEKYAKEKNFPIAEFPAKWETLGRAAGFIRNKEMAQYADALIAFWNKKSKGTKHMINIASEMKLPTRIYYY